MLVLKHLFDWSFDECEREVAASGVPAVRSTATVPDASAHPAPLPGSVLGWSNAWWPGPPASGRPGRAAAVDTRSGENIHYPTDSTRPRGWRARLTRTQKRCAPRDGGGCDSGSDAERRPPRLRTSALRRTGETGTGHASDAHALPRTHGPHPGGGPRGRGRRPTRSPPGRVRAVGYRPVRRGGRHLGETTGFVRQVTPRRASPPGERHGQLKAVAPEPNTSRSSVTTRRGSSRATTPSPSIASSGRSPSNGPPHVRRPSGACPAAISMAGTPSGGGGAAWAVRWRRPPPRLTPITASAKPAAPVTAREKVGAVRSLVDNRYDSSRPADPAVSGVPPSFVSAHTRSLRYCSAVRSPRIIRNHESDRRDALG